MKSTNKIIIGVPSTPLFLLIGAVAWFVLVPGVWVAVHFGVLAYLVMLIMTIFNRRWFETLVGKARVLFGAGA